MKTLAFAALFMGATGLLACGGGDDDNGPTFIDGGDEVGTCNPVTQQGCADGEKCSWIVAQVTPSFLGQTACVRDGNVDVGGACSDSCIPKGSTEIGEPCSETNAPDSAANPPIVGTDDCAAGGICVNSECKAICQGQDSCAAEQACVSYGDLFTEAEDIGACSATCDPLIQDCGEGFGCYVDPFPGKGYATCESELHPERTQDTICTAGDCSLNGCAAGFGPWLSNADDETVCTRISGHKNTYLIDPEGVGYPNDDTLPLAEGSDPDGAPDAASCSQPNTGVSGLQSYSLQAFYTNTTETPAEWGICAAYGVDNGDCTHWSMEFVFKTFDDAEADPAAPTGMEAVATLCGTEDVCGFSCTDNATFEAVIAPYCAQEPMPPSCASGARSKIQQILKDAASKKPVSTNVVPRFSHR
jgi:hypothetical protein